jgi:hypothetical protein
VAGIGSLLDCNIFMGEKKQEDVKKREGDLPFQAIETSARIA